MIFETLYESAERGELMLVDGGICHWHLRKDMQLTIREIISTRKGAGSQMLNRLMHIPGATNIIAKCPDDLEANNWYARRGFSIDNIEFTKSGRKLNVWRFDLESWRRIKRINCGNIELIFCYANNFKFAQIAIDNGWHYGAQLPNRVHWWPYFVDQDWKNPNLSEYVYAISTHKPYIASVLDLERIEQLDDVLMWSEEISPYVQEIMIIPKVNGVIERLPREIGGRRVRLGYSLKLKKKDDKFATGTNVPLLEFVGWPIHLLGGSPEKQMEIARISEINVVSVDGNYAANRSQVGSFFSPGWRKPTNGNWPTMSEFGLKQFEDMPYKAWEFSAKNIMREWNELNYHDDDLKTQMKLFDI